MQDEVNEKTIALYIKTGKLTAQTLQKAMKAILSKGKKHLDTSRPLGNGHQLAYSLEYQCNCFPTQKLSYSVLPLCRQ